MSHTISTYCGTTNPVGPIIDPLGTVVPTFHAECGNIGAVRLGRVLTCSSCLIGSILHLEHTGLHTYMVSLRNQVCVNAPVCNILTTSADWYQIRFTTDSIDTGQLMMVNQGDHRVQFEHTGRTVVT